MKTTRILALVHVFALSTTAPTGAFAKGNSQLPSWCSTRPDCREFDGTHRLSENPGLVELECNMRSSHYRRCGSNAQSCKLLNDSAHEEGLISERVASLATQKGICVVPVLGFIAAVCPGETPANLTNCEGQSAELPIEPSLDQIQCYLKQIKEAGRETWPGVTFEECESLNLHAAAQGLVSGDVASQASERGICLVAPASLHRITTIWEVCSA